MKKAIKDLQSGDLVDLQGDKHADPQSDVVSYKFEYAEVEAVVRETRQCYVVHFCGDKSCGFPPDHEVEVAQDE